MSKSRPPTTKQDLQPRSLSSMGFFSPRHTCQTFQGEHVSKSRGKPLVQLLARHGMPTTGGTAMALTADAWPPVVVSTWDAGVCPPLNQTLTFVLWGALSASRCPSSPNLQKKGPTAAPLLQCAKLCCHVGCPQSWACMRGSMAWGRAWPTSQGFGAQTRLIHCAFHHSVPSSIKRG